LTSTTESSLAFVQKLSMLMDEMRCVALLLCMLYMGKGTSLLSFGV